MKSVEALEPGGIDMSSGMSVQLGTCNLPLTRHGEPSSPPQVATATSGERAKFPAPGHAGYYFGMHLLQIAPTER